MSMEDREFEKLLRKHDADRFLVSLYAPRPLQADLWPLYLFNYEIAKTREVVTETRLGLIRLQWWREALEPAFTGGQLLSHEIVEAVGALIQKYDLPQKPFETLLYAREFDLEDVQPETLEGLVNYADFTNTPLLELTRIICGLEGVSEEDLRPLGVAYGLTGLMRAVLAHAKDKRILLPTDLCEAHHVSLSRYYEGQPQDGICGVLFDIAGEAARNLDMLDGKSLPHPFRAQAKLVRLYLNMMRKSGYDPFDSKYYKEPALKALRLL
ncbi:MAG: squalene/phytoene synthase family protein [Pseudobdellovibrionaceae bacterium]